MQAWAEGAELETVIKIVGEDVERSMSISGLRSLGKLVKSETSGLQNGLNPLRNVHTGF